MQANTKKAKDRNVHSKPYRPKITSQKEKKNDAYMHELYNNT